MAERPVSIPAPLAEHRLSDYRPPAFLVDTVDLIFDLDPKATRVRATLALRRNPAHGDAAAPLVLDGEDLTLNAVAVDGVALDAAAYRLGAHGLVIADLPDACTLDTDVTIDPAGNTQLSGLYVSGGDFFTQCEAEGFRRITFFPDRPDVMARYSATLVADAARYPVLLSNGNPVDRGAMPDGRAWVKWVDPHPKPSYLFALVAGKLVSVHDEFITASGRRVALGIYVRQGDEDKVDHAMVCLKRSMRWDEEVFGLEYDLDIFNIAAVGDFNAGAMENKGLNIFNTALVLARPDTATDADYLRIDRVIAHEYFHNWTGDRVTCRDWFQLSLKEGLTVFRDQEYGADTTDASLSRIEDVLRLRGFQFREDGGPLAHPVRPPAYRKIDNFYTATVYEKGAEVVRMIRTIIGADAFRRGMDIYFANNDNTAATIEDFVAAMHEASGYDFTQFMRWYDQAGTPAVSFAGTYDAKTRRYTLTLRQATAPTPGQAEKAPFVIPVALGLIGPEGQDLAGTLDGETVAGTRVVLLTEAEQSFVFTDVAAAPVPSLFRNFSAPIRLSGYDRAQLAMMAAHDSDGFNRWEAGHEYAVQVLLEAIALHQGGARFVLDDGLRDARAAALDHAAAAPALAARLLALPGASTLADRMTVVDPDAIHAVLTAARRAIGEALHARFRAVYAQTAYEGPFAVDPASVGRRALRNACLAYLMAADEADGIALAQAQIAADTTMTESLTALALLVDTASPARDTALAAFHARFQDDALVIDKFFAIQAMSSAPDTLARIDALTRHPDFDIRNPNRYRSLVSAFGYRNPLWFHDASGAGYDFVARMTLAADKVNRSVAARGMEVFADWKRYDPARQEKMRAALDRILAANDLSANTREMAERVRKG
ncbi:aminopeptidase N [Acidiphilium sp. PA]|uniref:aminopeptidase N n=1 Tax=Acidiphilium sp. PA TaxID=2871705 RepID=UPI002243466F|nr:aminopeptidase N [Acidiphilium sp. PA]MCW8307919.1 aminopeptidase N [Acidiphilium sp. PA]